MPVMLERWNDDKMDALSAKVDDLGGQMGEQRKEMRAERREMRQELREQRQEMKAGFEQGDAKLLELRQEINGRFDGIQRTIFTAAVVMSAGFLAGVVTLVADRL
jgi:predicted  nucleic acid-binding Zn-ribbon protein